MAKRSSGKSQIEDFVIDPSYITDITIRTDYSLVKDPNDLLEVIKQSGKEYYSISNEDHPEFKKLRNLLEEQGFIKCERGWWNGDRVLRPFRLNGWKFNKEHKFPCAAALKSSISCAEKYGWKSISSY